MKSNPTLSILIIFYNNRREARNSLYSLSAEYQTSVTPDQYNVIAIDSGSSKPLNPKVVESFGPNFSYHQVSTKHPSPTASLHFGLSLVKTPYVGIIIDGAHILSPGILKYFFEIQSFKPNSFVYTTKYHLGKYHQNDSMTLGYNQELEDELMNSTNWKENGYLLYHISNFHNAPFNEFLFSLESNCFFVLTNELRSTKIFEQPYHSIGGGFINLALFKHFSEHPKFDNYLLLGEGTFHQFHEGASTNVARELHPIKEYRKEYLNINGVPFKKPIYDTYYYGKYNVTIAQYKPLPITNHLKAFLDEELATKSPDAFLGCIQHAIEKFPFNIPLRIRLAHFYEKNSDFSSAEKVLLEAREISRQTLEAPRHLFQLYFNYNKFDLAEKYINEALTINAMDPILFLQRAKLAKATAHFDQLNHDVKAARKFLDLEFGADPIFHSNAVFYLLELGKIGLAGKYLKRALLISPNHPKLLSLAINILPKTNDAEIFRSIVKRIFRLPLNQRPENLYKRLGFAFQYIGDYAESVNYYQQFLDKFHLEEMEQESFSFYNYTLSLAMTKQIGKAKEYLLYFEKQQFATNFIPHIKFVKAIFKFHENKIQDSLDDVLDLIKPLFSKAVYRALVDLLLVHLNKNQTTSLLTTFLNHTCLFSRSISIPHQELLKRINEKNNQFKSNVHLHFIIKNPSDHFDGFIFTHIQKTAGTSIRRYFAWASRLSNISNVHIPGEFGTLFKTNTIQLSQEALKSLEENKVKMFLEHFSYQETLPPFLKHLKNPFYFTILREPWSRFVSYYYFFCFQKHPIWNKDLAELSQQNLTTLINKYRNIQTAYVAGIPWHLDLKQLVKEQHLDLAKENLLSKYHSFGLFEALDETMKRLSEIAPSWLQLPNLEIPSLNQNKQHTPKVNGHVKNLFLEMNAFDVSLYNYAKEIFEQPHKSTLLHSEFH